MSTHQVKAGVAIFISHEDDFRTGPVIGAGVGGREVHAGKGQTRMFLQQRVHVCEDLLVNVIIMHHFILFARYSPANTQ